MYIDMIGKVKDVMDELYYDRPIVEVLLGYDWNIFKEINRRLMFHGIRCKLSGYDRNDVVEHVFGHLYFWKNCRQKDIEVIEGILGKKKLKDLIDDKYNSIKISSKDIYKLYVWTSGYKGTYKDFRKICCYIADGKINLRIGRQYVQRYVAFGRDVLSDIFKFEDNKAVKVDCHIFAKGIYSNKIDIMFYVCPDYQYIDSKVLKKRATDLADCIKDRLGLPEYDIKKENELVYSARFKVNNAKFTFANLKTFMRMKRVNTLKALVN